METIKKRSVLLYAVVNILTLGIYGIIEGNSIGNDIDALCSGDGETEVSYVKAWLLGIVTGGIYLEYWWYKQANRLKYNAGRYNLEVRESGLSLVAFRSFTSIFAMILKVFIIIRLLSSFIISFYMSALGMFGMPYRYGMSFSSFMPTSVKILLVLMLISALTPSWGIMGYVGLSFLIKNLNRYSDANYNYDALPFDPMGYEYYDASCNYPEGQVKRQEVVIDSMQRQVKEKAEVAEGLTEMLLGHVEGVSGNNKGYRFEMKDGEEIIIGKDPNVSNVIIDPKYRDVSRKHCGITYIAASNEYQITDYSANGTYVNGKRIPVRVRTKVSPGTEFTLAESDNRFRLG